MEIIIKLIVSALAVMLTAYILPGIHVRSFWTAFWVAIILALLNTFVTPLMILLTIPVTIFTLGLFLFVINALVVLIASAIVSGFKVDGFIWALIFSIILSFVTYIFERIVNVDLLNM